MTTIPHPLIDLEVNGYQAVDFSSPDLTYDRALQACRALVKKGVSAWCPTLITSQEPTYQHNLPILARVAELPEFADVILGFHLEGPFLSSAPGAVGAHNPEWTRLPDIDLLERLQTWAQGHVKILTLAADLPAADSLTTHACRMGISVFLAHQLANLEDHRRLAAAGATAITHLGNSMPDVMHRHDNLFLHGLAVDELAATIITDGHHLSPDLIRIILRCKGADNVAVISDAAPLAGMPPGEYATPSNRVILEPSGRLFNPEKNVKVGSTATIVECYHYMKSLNLLNPADLEKLFHQNPLRLLNLKP